MSDHEEPLTHEEQRTLLGIRAEHIEGAAATDREIIDTFLRGAYDLLVDAVPSLRNLAIPDDQWQHARSEWVLAASKVFGFTHWSASGQDADELGGEG